MITRQEFDKGAAAVRTNLMATLPRMVRYKNLIQTGILDIASRKELEDVRDSRLNQGMIDKLARLCKKVMDGACDAESVYCGAMAVGTIIKEYDWGDSYLTPDGLYDLAIRILDS